MVTNSLQSSRVGNHRFRSINCNEIFQIISLENRRKRKRTTKTSSNCSQTTIQRSEFLIMARNHHHLSLYYSHYLVDYSRFFNGLYTVYFQKRVGGSMNMCVFHFIGFSSYTTDGTIALFIGALPLLLPDRNPFQSR